MNYFTDFETPKTSRYGITNLFSNCPSKKESHKGGWTRLLRCQMVNERFKDVSIISKDAKLSDYDAIILDFGAEYSGTLNLFGGLDENVYERIIELVAFKGPIFSWQHAMPDIEVLLRRVNNVSTCKAMKGVNGAVLLNQLAKVLREVKVFDYVAHRPVLQFCDSHGPGMWNPDNLIERKDGRSLLKCVTHSSIDKYLDSGDFKHVILQLGSIDIRHHLMRLTIPIASLRMNMKYLESRVTRFGITVEWAETIGIESVTRKLPKTGWFNNKPYNGSWKNRDTLRQAYNKRCERLKYPDYFYNELGELKFEVMELPGSVHISPEHYMWDLDKNEKRRVK